MYRSSKIRFVLDGVYSSSFFSPPDRVEMGFHVQIRLIFDCKNRYQVCNVCSDVQTRNAFLVRTGPEGDWLVKLVYIYFNGL